MPDSRILLGVIGRPHGVRGLVHVTSHTANPADLTAYGPLSDASGRHFALRWRGDGVAEVAELVNGTPIRLPDRRAAEQLTNTPLFIDRSALPAPDPDEFYLADLVGLTANDTAGATLGTVAAVHDYGAGTSLEIARPDAPPLLVPFTRAAVPEVDVAGGHLTVVPPTEVADAPNTPSPLEGEGRGEGSHTPRPRGSRPLTPLGPLRGPSPRNGGESAHPRTAPARSPAP